MKYFYRLGLIFLCAVLSGHAVTAVAAPLDEADLAAIQKIKEHNKRQEKNRVSLDKYHQENPNSMTPQPDEYWDMAWHARLADYGDEESQYVIAKAYDKGIQVDQNPKKAVAFYEKACDQEHIDSCMRLGEIYLENKWVKEDKEKSLYWYTKAGKAGYVQAQLKVSELYKEKGDYIAAIKWLESGLKKLFPESENLEQASPELTELRRLATVQARVNKWGVQKNILHESVLTSFSPRTLKIAQPTSPSVLQISNAPTREASSTTHSVLKPLSSKTSASNAGGI